MYHSRCAVVLCLLALSALGNRASAENAALINAFGGEPGGPLPHAYSYGLPDDEAPYYRLRIAAVERTVKTILHDTELTVRRADKIVERVSGDRAYRTLAECEVDRATLAEKLEMALPTPAADDQLALPVGRRCGRRARLL